MFEKFWPGNRGTESFHTLPEKEEKWNVWVSAFWYPKPAYSCFSKAGFWWGEAQCAEEYLLLSSCSCQRQGGGLDSALSWLG